MTASRRVITFIGLALFLVVPIPAVIKLLPALPGVPRPYGHEWIWWALFAAVLLYVLAIERRSLRTIGFGRVTWKSLVFGIAGAVVALVGIGLIFAFVMPVLQPKGYAHGMNAILHLPLWYRVYLVTRAAVVEETLFRGYGIERLIDLTGNRWIAGAVSWAVFTCAHLSYWGWGALIVAGYGGLVLTLLYLWRRDLVCNMIAHWLTDGAGFLLPH